jgi:hypothetical protein
MRKHKWLTGGFAGTALALLCVVAPARGGLVIVTTPADYNAATTGNTTVNFAGIAPANGFVTVPVPPGLTLGGVNFTIDTAASNGTLFVVDGGFSNNPWKVPLLDSQFSSATNENILITLPQPVTAAAFDFGSLNATTVTFTLSTGDTFTADTTGKPNLEFLGVLSSNPFTSIELSQPIGSALVLEDFTSGTVVPEPASINLVVASGFGLLCYGWRRRRLALA